MDSGSLKDRKRLRALATGESLRTISSLLDSGGPLMPDPGPHQLRLEAELLFVVPRIAEALAGREMPARQREDERADERERMTAQHLWLHNVVEKVTPQAESLRLYLTPAAAELILAEILPRDTARGFVGIPGLRLSSIDRDRIRLVLPGAEERPLAELSLHCAGQNWRRPLRAVEAEDGVSHWSGSRHLDVGRQGRHRFPPRTAAHLSSVLRRIAPWLNAQWFTPHVFHDMVVLTWFEGPSARAVSELLVAEHVGIPGTTVWYGPGDRPGLPRKLLIVPSAAAVPGRPPSQEAIAEIGADRQVTRTARTPLPENWDQVAVRRALAELDVGTLLGLLHDEGYPVGKIAQMTGWSPRRLRAVRAGVVSLRRDEVNDLARGLGIPHDFIGETGGDTRWNTAASRELVAMLRKAIALDSATTAERPT